MTRRVRRATEEEKEEDDEEEEEEEEEKEEEEEAHRDMKFKNFQIFISSSHFSDTIKNQQNFKFQ